MSEDSIIHDGVTYVSTKQAAADSGYTTDYIGQLARGGKIRAVKAHRAWFVDPHSVAEHKVAADEYVPVPPQNQPETPLDTIVGLDGVEYISAKRGADITSYTPDYVTQLARTGKVPGKHIGGRWYVAQERLVRHKAEKDALLAAVQAESAGVHVPSVSLEVKTPQVQAQQPLAYLEDQRDLFPAIQAGAKSQGENKLQNVLKHSDSGKVIKLAEGHAVHAGRVATSPQGRVQGRQTVPPGVRSQVPVLRKGNPFALALVGTASLTAVLVFLGAYFFANDFVARSVAAAASALPDNFLSSVVTVD